MEQPGDRCFEHFSNPNELAVALSDNSSAGYELALRALKNINHFQPFSKWYISLDYFQSRTDDILFIGFQESLNQDFEKLKGRLNIPAMATLPSDDVAAHRNPSHLDRSLDETGTAALKEWFAGDYEFMALCKEHASRTSE